MKSALLVDSDPPICALLQEILKSEGMDAVTLASASQAADYARAQKFDVVFVDSSSPVSDGIELTRKIRGSGFNRKTPIVMITTPKYTGFLTEGFEAGASFLVYKPLDRTRLLRLVRVTQGAIENEIRRFRRVAVELKARVKGGSEEIDAATIDVSLERPGSGAASVSARNTGEDLLVSGGKGHGRGSGFGETHGERRSDGHSVRRAVCQRKHAATGFSATPDHRVSC